MAVTATPIFAQTAHQAVVAISTANTGRDGSGTVGTIFTAGANGSVIDHIDICATGTTTAGVVRLFIHNGTSSFLWKEVLVGAITPSTSIAAFMRSINCAGQDKSLFLQSGWSLRAATHNAETFNIHAYGADF